ncbi:uncharacterized protein LOC108733650 [Agrilus planipennis]|uniref:Uncharacterized protein LOC108733650 n=1 Tax=Agrilus planipennis TaxID=224129 RepID=A0A1W4W8M0_AGRPL|nr:uncharacterized protein LOC108733650 [Agrilus planipennis]
MSSSFTFIRYISQIDIHPVRIMNKSTTKTSNLGGKSIVHNLRKLFPKEHNKNLKNVHQETSIRIPSRLVTKHEEAPPDIDDIIEDMVQSELLQVVAEVHDIPKKYRTPAQLSLKNDNSIHENPGSVPISSVTPPSYFVKNTEPPSTVSIGKISFKTDLSGCKPIEPLKNPSALENAPPTPKSHTGETAEDIATIRVTLKELATSLSKVVNKMNIMAHSLKTLTVNLGEIDTLVHQHFNPPETPEDEDDAWLIVESSNQVTIRITFYLGYI